MATNTYVALQTTTLGTAASSYTFTSIPAGYTDLVLVANVVGTSAGGDVWIRVGTGSVATTNYSRTALTGNGTAASSSRTSNDNRIYLDDVVGISTGSSMFTVHLMNYSNTTTYKTTLGRRADAAAETNATVGLWRATTAIDTVSVMCSSNFAVGSTFTLYGILAEVGGSTPKAVGGIVTSDATYWYHTFNDSGNFTPNQTLSVDYLVVGSGGGGGWGRGGGGGAGGKFASTLSCTANARLNVLIGAGGAGGAAQPTKGSDTTFSSVTANGGGYGGSVNATSAGGSGTSGGGGTGISTGLNANGGAVSPSGQGNVGGGGYFDATNGRQGGGGGGNSGAGANGTATTGGNGGAGYTSTISGTSVVYAGGGGGGVGGPTPTAGTGTGGGGNGGNEGASILATSGTANLGGGGGGGGAAGGNGGSGVVILRYAK